MAISMIDLNNNFFIAHSCYKSAHAWGGGWGRQIHFWLMFQKMFMPGNIQECHACCLYQSYALFLTCYQSAHLLSKGSTEGLHLLI